MSELDKDWKPEFGTIYTWFAMDKNGLIAVMINNCWGDIPKSILEISNAESLLDDISEYIWEESEKYISYPNNKKGRIIVDLYSHWRNIDELNNEEITKRLKIDLVKSKNYSEANLSVNKGFFVYHAIEGSQQGEDYPVGYEKYTKMGDYFRYLIPTVYASVNDFPKQLWHGIAVSDSIDFTKDRVLDNDKINEYFTSNYNTE